MISRKYDTTAIIAAEAVAALVTSEERVVGEGEAGSVATVARVEVADVEASAAIVTVEVEAVVGVESIEAAVVVVAGVEEVGNQITRPRLARRVEHSLRGRLTTDHDSPREA